MRTLFKGGSVVSGSGVRRLDLLTEGEKVAAMGRNLNKYHRFCHGKIKKFEGKPEEPAA